VEEKPSRGRILREKHGYWKGTESQLFGLKSACRAEKPTYWDEKPTFRAGDIRGLRRIPSNEPISNKRYIVPSMMLNILNFYIVFFSWQI
jgi:hypothetical protein